MNSTLIPDRQVTVNDLRKGDLLIWTIHGLPHSAIYSPVEGQQADIIHMYINNNRTCGLYKGTLSHQQKTLGDDTPITIIRSTVPHEGEEIAQQAEFWLRQGVKYDIKRFAEAIYKNAHRDEFPSVEDNIRQYLKYAARRETMPIKSHELPYTQASYLALGGLWMMLGSAKNACYGGFSRQGLKLVNYAVDAPDRDKGFNCAGFILATIAAVKLKDEVLPVNEKTGWVSMSELDKVLSEKNIDVERLAAKLTPAIANTHPHLPDGKTFFETLLKDKVNWECLGTLNPKVFRARFNKEAYEEETTRNKDEVRQNHAAFCKKFGDTIFASRQAASTRTSGDAAEITPKLSP